MKEVSHRLSIATITFSLTINSAAIYYRMSPTLKSTAGEAL